MGCRVRWVVSPFTAGLDRGQQKRRPEDRLFLINFDLLPN